MADYKENEEEELEIEEPNDSDFVEEHGDAVTCVVQKFLCNQKASTQRNDIKSSTQGVRSRARYATSSLTMKVVRISFLKHLWII